jgi:hypothetical protein
VLLPARNAPCQRRLTCPCPPLANPYNDNGRYRTLYGASVSANIYGRYNTQEQSFKTMPQGYDVSPDDSDIVANVIAPHLWDVWRLCTSTKCWGGYHYGPGHSNEHGTLKDSSRHWQQSGSMYRITPGNDWYRLLIRTKCN